MSKPDDIPQDVWDAANAAWVRGASSANVTNTGQETVARAIMAERERSAKIAEAFGGEIKNDGTVSDVQVAAANIAIPITIKHIAAAIRKGVVVPSKFARRRAERIEKPKPFKKVKAAGT